MHIRRTTIGYPISYLLTLVLAIISLPVGWVNVASAALLVYEPFDYDAGTVLHESAATGLNLAGDYAAVNPGLPSQFQLVTESPGLNYGNLNGALSEAGNQLSQTLGTTAGGITVSLDEDVVVRPDDAIFFSALFVFDDSLNGNHLANITFTDDETGDELSFGEPSVGIRNVRVSADTAATGQLIADGADGSFTNGQTLFLVGRYVNSAAISSDSLELLGYNTADADVLPATFDPADPNAEFAYSLADLDIDFAKISSITFTIRGTASNFIDELRIGSTYASVVVPEPASALLLVAGLWLTAARPWRGRTRNGALQNATATLMLL